MSERQTTIHELHERLVNKETTARALTEAYFAKIEAGAEINAYISLNKDAALAQADAVDAKIARGEEIGMLEGIPMAVKDNICTEGLRTTCASKMLDNFVPQYDAAVVEKLHAAGAIILGKTNMDEFAMGSTTETSFYGPTKNPVNYDCVPGGSSGGSAAAVADGEAVYALGSDTGGSIRQPAAFCGIVGLKPTYGAVSRYGLIAFASSLDQIGPIVNDVKDAGIVMNALAGYDHRDSTSANVAYEDFTRLIGKDIKGVKIAMPVEYIGEGVEPAIKEKLDQVRKILEEKGAIVEECSLPTTNYAIPAYYLIAPAEASSNLARYDGVRYGLREQADDMITMFKETRQKGFGDEVKRRIMLGTYALSAGYYDAYYLKALKVRHLIKNDFEKAFETYDCLLTPASVVTAPEIGKEYDAVTTYKQDICTVTSNLAGLPAISVPFGKDEKGLPVGIQFIGKPFDEAFLLQVAYEIEQSAQA
ncbi:MAG: Asp-tRNA(Asn)/Glu-tRNA(Gln) amidotransferase subunit GatA [Peptococcaceae bacterium]|nr:Asp-tRNA(Asn)/Glu-tRNA(Gln) amidotransferase subunit GatA [Peptococcaceae bacterium]